jgi:hypothetical protein
VPNTLDEAWSKLQWARKHLDVVRTHVEPIDQGDAYNISVDIDPNAGTYIFRVHNLEPLDSNLGLMIGDCLHNARTALDYLMVRLVALTTGQEPSDIEHVQFPICTTPDQFGSKTGELRKDLALRGYLTRIEELQPFNNGNTSIWGSTSLGQRLFSGVPAALEKLAQLDNRDKHRAVHAVWLGHSALGTEEAITIPDDFKRIVESENGKPLENGTEIAGWGFETPLPREWHPSEIDMKREFPLEVSLDEPFLFNGVREVLPFCLWGAEAVLRLFDAVFTSHGTPLPVTAALAWEQPGPAWGTGSSN